MFGWALTVMEEATHHLGRSVANQMRNYDIIVQASHLLSYYRQPHFETQQGHRESQARSVDLYTASWLYLIDKPDELISLEVQSFK